MANFESGYRSILSVKLNPADTSLTVATAPTVTSGRLYLNNGAQEERIKFTGRTLNVLTGLVRGLSKTADPATAGTGLTWVAGSEVKLVDMHDQLWDESKTETITGNKTFSGNNVHTGTETFNGETNLGALSDLNVIGKSNPTPVVADDTARDALYPSPVVNDRVYNVTVQAEQVYNGGAWDTYGISTPTPNASETVSGKVEIATKTEAYNGTDVGGTGAPLVTKPSLVNGAIGNTYFGTGVDGDVTITTTVTLSRDMFYNNLIINSPGILIPDGYRVYVKGTLSGDGKIQRNGNNGGNGGNTTSGTTAGGTAGATLNQGSLNAEIAAGAGGNSAINDTSYSGDSGGSSNPSYSNINGVAGGHGGKGYSEGGGGLGGVGGTTTRGTLYNTVYSIESLLAYFTCPAATTTSRTVYNSSLFGTTQYKVISGSGGGGGGGSRGGVPTSGGGGGGAGSNGGMIWIAVKHINRTGTFEAKGGNGGNGGNGDGSTDFGVGGGGSGGSGGVLFMIYRVISSAGSTVLTKGTKGIKGINGGLTNATDGADGNDGISILTEI